VRSFSIITITYRVFPRVDDGLPSSLYCSSEKDEIFSSIFLTWIFHGFMVPYHLHASRMHTVWQIFTPFLIAKSVCLSETVEIAFSELFPVFAATGLLGSNNLHFSWSYRPWLQRSMIPICSVPLGDTLSVSFKRCIFIKQQKACQSLFQAQKNKMFKKLSRLNDLMKKRGPCRSNLFFGKTGRCPQVLNVVLFLGIVRNQ
jgi:hypothetical protein